MNTKIFKCFCGWVSTAHKNEAIKHANLTFHVVEFFRVGPDGTETFESNVLPTATLKVTAKDIDLGD